MVVSQFPTILYVDDDKQYRATYVEIFKQAGFAVQEAATGEDALRLAAQNPDLVVLDVNLPDMNGYEVCRRIKSHPATTSIPVLHLSTVFVHSRERTQSVEEGADGYLTKPVAPDELLAHVKALLRVRQAEEALREAARQWQSTFDAASDGVCLVNAAGMVQRCNRALAGLLGLPLSAILGRPYQSLMQAALTPAELPDLTALHRSGRRETCELSSRGRWFHATADPVTDERGRVTGSVHILADITELKRVEEERTRLLADRAKLADHLRLLLESTAEGIFGIDQEGRCTFITRSAAAMLGYASEDFVGLDVHAQIHHSYADGTPYPPHECPMLRAIATGEGCRIASEVFWRRNGTSFPTEYSAHPIRTRSGSICGVVLTFTDITERLLLERQLIQSQKLEAVGRLAGGVAHDFNNLMAVVIGNVSVLLAGLAREHPHREALLAIDQAAWRASELTRRLLGFSRQTKLWLKPCDIRPALDEIVALLRRTIDPRITIQVACPGDLWPIQADPGQLNQVLMNLCLNARDAMPDGGRLLLQAENVSLDEKKAQQHVDAHPGDYVRVRVADTGHGIAADILPRIFEPFFTTKEAGKGTGLGLAMVFGIIKQHQGWITCSSAVDRGTCFDIYLPRSKESAGPTVAAAAAVELPGGSETILVVDDEPMLRTLAQKILQERGYRVLVAADGPEAIEMFRVKKDAIDLIILDLTMPRLSGRDTLKRLRHIDPAVRVLYASGFAVKVTEAVNDEVLGFIAKPYRAEDLALSVRAALDKTRP
jgi:PAS domain S-box-containing protein